MGLSQHVSELLASVHGLPWFFLFVCFFFLVAPLGLWDLSSLTRD